MASKHKPTVFLSHSSKNRRELIRLKSLLDAKTVGAIDFFLASDEESIRLGTLWPQEVRIALDRAKLMFVFVSNDSLQSGWTYFEAGYGYCNLDRVIPLCLPGIDKGRVPPPLGLLQARNLHTSADLNVLLRTCNEVFGTRAPENFTGSEFQSVFSVTRLAVEPTVNWIEQIDKLVLKIDAQRGSEDKFVQLCAERQFDCDESGLNKMWSPKIVASGVTLTFEGLEVADLDFLDTSSDESQQQEPTKTAKESIGYEFELAPELIEETFPLLDKWKSATDTTGWYALRLTFADSVAKEPKPHQLTQRIYRSEISLRSTGAFCFRNVEFNLHYERGADYRHRVLLQLEWHQELAQLQLADLLRALFTLGVLIDTSRTATKRSKR
jgi:hypothetical protein